MKTVEELEAALKAIEPGKEVTIVYKAGGKEIVLKGTAK